MSHGTLSDPVNAVPPVPPGDLLPDSPRTDVVGLEVPLWEPPWDDVLDVDVGGGDDEVGGGDVDVEGEGEGLSLGQFVRSAVPSVEK
jgi:hypothetical protein